MEYTIPEVKNNKQELPNQQNEEDNKERKQQESRGKRRCSLLDITHIFDK